MTTLQGLETVCMAAEALRLLFIGGWLHTSQVITTKMRDILTFYCSSTRFFFIRNPSIRNLGQIGPNLKKLLGLSILY